MSALVAAAPRDRALALSLRACAKLVVILGVAVTAAAARLAPSVSLSVAPSLPGASATLAASAGVAIAVTLAATPLCVGAATWRARMVPASRRADLGGILLDALRVVPPVVAGAVVALALRGSLGVAGALGAGAAVMACANLASFVALCEEAVRAVPRALEEDSLALGATPWFTLRRVTWPSAAGGIAAAALRAMGRVAGECAPMVLALAAVGARGGATEGGALGAAATLVCLAVALTLAGRAVSARYSRA